MWEILSILLLPELQPGVVDHQTFMNGSAVSRKADVLTDENKVELFVC